MKKDKEKQAGYSENDNNENKEKRGVIKVINDYKRKKEIEAAENDVIFSEPLTPVEEEPPKPLVKGSIDRWFFLFAAMLIFFGSVMSYSASAVVAETEHGSSTYFLVSLYLLNFLLLL